MKNHYLIVISIIIAISCKDEHMWNPEHEYKASLRHLKSMDEKGLATKEVYNITIRKLMSLTSATSGVHDSLNNIIRKSLDSLNGIARVPGFRGTTKGKTWEGTYTFSEIKSHFNKIDTSHIKLTEFVISKMKEPAKFKHIFSRALLDDSYYWVTISYFNDTVVAYENAKCDIKTGDILEIIETENY